MAVLHLREEEVRRLVTMPQAIEAVEQVFRSLGEGEAQNRPRQRVRIPGVMLHLLGAAVTPLGYVGWKTYTTTRDRARFHVALYDQQGAWKGLLEADWLGQLRTGAASGVATKYLANIRASSVGVIGSGKQARTQLTAMCAVRPVERATVYGRSAEKRELFAAEMSAELELDVVPVASVSECVKNAEIIVTATTSREPVLPGSLLRAGVHVNAIGSNSLQRAELETSCFDQIARVVCDDVESCQREAGDFVEPLEKGVFDWKQARSLSELVLESSGTLPDVEPKNESTTLFKSVGMAIEDIAVAAIAFEKALAGGIGRMLEL